MAEENQDGQEKTEEPTQQRLQKAAEDGQLLTSKEMMVFTTLAMGLSVTFDAGQIGMHGCRVSILCHEYRYVDATAGSEIGRAHV